MYLGGSGMAECEQEIKKSEEVDVGGGNVRNHSTGT